jgi:superfamily II DNA/RNA helicase
MINEVKQTSSFDWFDDEEIVVTTPPAHGDDVKADRPARASKKKVNAEQETSQKESSEVTTNGFASLGLCGEILKALDQCGYQNPTDVQIAAIPAFLKGRDLLVSSRTGSGKTAAFMLPAIQKISELPARNVSTRNKTFVEKRNGRGFGDDSSSGRRGRNHRGERGGGKESARPVMLVLTPTRELAIQVADATTKYGRFLRQIESASILGGMPYPKQLSMLARQPEILVATPGRLLDHMRSGRIDLSALSMLVFDEADLMLDMGFADDINAVLDSIGENCQTLMFSATIDQRVESLAKGILKDPVRIEVKSEVESKSHITQHMYWTDDIRHKENLLCHLLDDRDVNQGIVFVSTKLDSERVAEVLMDQGFSARAIHGDMSQAARNRTLTSVRKGQVQVLVATDVAARGIDIPDITHVINFDIPRQAEDYVHRIGRTGRAGRSGLAITLINHSQKSLWDRIIRVTKNEVSVAVVPGLEPKQVTRAKKRPVGMKPGSGKPQRSGGFKTRFESDRPRRGESRGESSTTAVKKPSFFDDRQAPKKEGATRFTKKTTFSKAAAPAPARRSRGDGASSWSN